MNIIETKHKWNGTLAKRNSTKYIILHHRAGNGTVESIHAQHLTNGWTGIGYHFYVRKDGCVYRGRPVETVGAHCQGQNSYSVGICFEGNFENEKMSAKQLKAGQELVVYLKSLYPKAEIFGHKDFGGTACPGKNFPFERIKKEVDYSSQSESSFNYIQGDTSSTASGPPSPQGEGLLPRSNQDSPLRDGASGNGRIMLESANDIIWELMNGKLKVQISEVDKAVKVLDEAKKANSSLYWILYKIVNG